MFRSLQGARFLNAPAWRQASYATLGRQRELEHFKQLSNVWMCSRGVV